MHHATKQSRYPSKKHLLLAVVGLIVVIAAITLGQRALRPASAAAMAIDALAQAIERRDAETAMSMIDFDAVFEDAWRESKRQITGVEPTDQEVELALVNPMVFKTKETARKNLSAILADPAKAAEDSGALYAALLALDAAEVVAEDDASAEVRLPNDYKLMLARHPEKGWRVVAFRGYEKDFGSYRDHADDLLRQKGLLAPKPDKGTGAAQ